MHIGVFTSKRREPFLGRELFPHELLQSIQRTVGERWGNNSSLWSPIRRCVEDVFFHISRFQPLLENDSVHGDVSQKPIVGDSVETGLDVALQNPLWIWMGQYCETLVNRIGTRPLLAKPVRVFVSSGFQHGIECQQMQCLMASIFHGGDT